MLAHLGCAVASPAQRVGVTSTSDFTTGNASTIAVADAATVMSPSIRDHARSPRLAAPCCDQRTALASGLPGERVDVEYQELPTGPRAAERAWSTWAAGYRHRRPISPQPLPEDCRPMASMHAVRQRSQRRSMSDAT